MLKGGLNEWLRETQYSLVVEASQIEGGDGVVEGQFFDLAQERKIGDE